MIKKNIVKNCLDVLPEIAKKNRFLYILFRKCIEENCVAVIDDDELHHHKNTSASGGLNWWNVHHVTNTKDDPKMHQPEDTMTLGDLMKARLT